MKKIFTSAFILIFAYIFYSFYLPVYAQCALPISTQVQTSSSSALQTYQNNSITIGGVSKYYPIAGTHNALFVFVQSKDDTYKDCKQFTGYNPSDGRPLFNDVSFNNCAPNGTLNSDSWQIGEYQSWDQNPTSEWPADLPNEGSDPTHMRSLPAWAKTGFIDAPNTTTITPNSLTEYYNQMSNGRFVLRGKVWPHTYVMDQNKLWYYNNVGNLGNAQGKMTHEIISYINTHPEGINYNDPAWDKFKNGEGENFTPDGRFDMIVIIFRYGNIKDVVGQNNVTTLGGDGYNLGQPVTHESNIFYASPLKLGNYDVIGAFVGGSGVYLDATTKTKAFKTTAHEIGHQQFGFYHTDDESMPTNAYDHFSIMNGNHDLSFTAQDRIKLGWANVQYIDVNTISNSQPFNLEDASIVSASTPDVLWIRSGATNQCGDIVIESRMRSTILDRKHGQGSIEDGDGADYFLPDEGLYISKAPNGTGSCGTGFWGFSSMPNGGIGRVKRGPGVLNKRHGGYIPGDVYSPFSVATHDFHKSSLDSKIAITNITQSGNGFSFTVWNNYLTSTSTNKVLSTFYNFNNDPQNIRQASGANLYGSFTLTGSPTIGTSATTTNLSFDTNSQLILNGTGINLKNTVMKGIAGNGSGTWRGVTMNYGSSAVFDNSKILNAGGCWGCAALSVNSASVTLNNSEIDVPSGGAVSGLYANAYGGSNSVSINNSKIKSASDIAVKAYGLPVGVANSQIVQANGTTALYTTNTTTTLGNDKLKGGKLSAGYNGAILGGLYSGYGSHNHFCDAASSSLEAFSGGYIYANNNYWNNTPTMSGSPIYYNGSMGAPNCTGVSTMQSTASEITRSVQNLRAQALGVGDATTEASLESALSKRGAGKIEEALAELRLVVNSGKMPDAQIALTQIGQIAVQYQKGPEQRGFVHEKLKKSDPLYLTALETSALLDATEGRTDDAIGTLKALANTDKGTKGFYAQLNMAQLYRQLGNINKAKASLSSAKPQDERQTTDLEMLLASLGESNTAHSLNQEIQELTDNVFASQNNEAIQITAYPNPFNPSTTFSYSLPAEADVRLTIYDVTGREVSVLVNQKQGKGIYQAIWHATSFASGTYFYKMMIGDKNLSGKIVLLK